MSTWPHPPRRPAASIGVCAALLFATFSCSGDAVPSSGGPDFTGEGAPTAGADTVSTAAADAIAEGTALPPETGPAAARPAAEETAAEQAPDPDSSAPASTSAAPVEPAVPEAPSEDPEATSTLASPGHEGPPDDDQQPADNPPPKNGQPVDNTPPEPVGEPVDVGESVEADDGPTHDRVWIVADAEYEAVSTARGNQPGVGVVAATDDLRALPRAARELISAASEVEILSEFGEDAAWQLEVVRRGAELPGGGLLLFETGDDDPDRRLVAAYGHPSTGGLGVLGEQGPEEAAERLQSMAEGYGADGSAVLPTFEIIATVASAVPGADGDYSSMTDREVIRPWIETAAADGVYVVLDLQPGRSDFLAQAKHYEEFLRLPHVGLALDPEWKLKPDQVHLAQIGAVDAAEINRVVDWLAGIVREEALPQKLLIVHQFRPSMVTNRDLIEAPPELAVLIHMDGQGSLPAKYDTWNRLTGQADVDRFYWGWKNFYDEDRPMAAPEQVLELSPRVVFVSFQ